MDAEMLAKWPDVPACYEWLALDRRGQWRLQGERELLTERIRALDSTMAIFEPRLDAGAAGTVSPSSLARGHRPDFRRPAGPIGGRR